MTKTKTVIPLESTEVDFYKKQIEEAEKFSVNLDVKSEDQYVEALKIVKHVDEQLELVILRQEQITKPMNDALKSTRQLFKPLVEGLTNVSQSIKKRMLRFTEAKEKAIEDAKSKLDSRVEKGTMKESTAEVKKFLIDNSVKKTVSTEEASATTRKVKKYYLTDIAQVPLEFLEVNMVKVRASFKAGFPVPGIEEKIESELVIK